MCSLANETPHSLLCARRAGGGVLMFQLASSVTLIDCLVDRASLVLETSLSAVAYRGGGGAVFADSTELIVRS